jgi:hypothetical protein
MATTEEKVDAPIKPLNLDADDVKQLKRSTTGTTVAYGCVCGRALGDLRMAGPWVDQGRVSSRAEVL